MPNIASAKKRVRTTAKRTKINQARKFLEHKDRVQVYVIFRGRELQHMAEGRRVLDVVDRLSCGSSGFAGYRCASASEAARRRAQSQAGLDLDSRIGHPGCSFCRMDRDGGRP